MTGLASAVSDSSSGSGKGASPTGEPSGVALLAAVERALKAQAPKEGEPHLTTSQIGKIFIAAARETGTHVEGLDKALGIKAATNGANGASNGHANGHGRTGADPHFFEKPLFVKFPDLIEPFKAAGILRSTDLATKLEGKGLGHDSAVVAASNYLQMKHTNPEKLPFGDATGKRVAEILTAANPEMARGRVAATPPAAEPLIAQLVTPPVAPAPVVAATPAPVPATASVSVPPRYPPAIVVAEPPASTTFRPAATVVAKLSVAPAVPAGPNYFEGFYGGKRVPDPVRAADISLTKELADGGITSYADLLKRRQENHPTLPVRKKTIDRLRNRASELGINSQLQVGNFRPGITSQPEPTPPPKSGGYAQGASFEDFTRRPDHRDTEFQRGTKRPEVVEKPKDFTTAVLGQLPPPEMRALVHFMDRLSHSQTGNHLMTHRVIGQPTDASALKLMSLQSILHPQRDEGNKAAMKSNDQMAATLKGMGVIDPATQTLTDAFTKRFDAVVDWHLRFRMERDRHHGHGQAVLAQHRK